MYISICSSKVCFFCSKVGEDEDKKGKSEYVNFKRVVWHESFRKLLESIVQYSKTGCWVQCGDQIPRHLFPIILILSADYEEQYVFVNPFYL